MSEEIKEIIKKETSDLSVAAYLLMRKQKILEVSPINAVGKFKFIFKDDGDFENLTIEYANSESREYDSSMRIIKMMMKSKQNNYRKEKQFNA